jgi:GGDEF domain-containing protein
MSIKFKVFAAGALFLIVSLFFYFTVRFNYLEREYIDTLVKTTNSIVREYHGLEKRAAEGKKIITPDDLSGFLSFIHKKHRDIALMAITDNSLSIRISSKNDRFIRSSDLFETILKDFTQEKFSISKSNPYIIRYYDEKREGRIERLKFYIFLNKTGEFRLLVAYPYTFGEKLFIRTALEIALVVLLIVIITAALFIVLKKKPRQEEDPSYTIDLDLGSRSVLREDAAVSRDTSAIAADTLGGYIHDLFRTIDTTYGTDSISLYIAHASGRLVKTMELRGKTFFRIDSISFDTIDIDNEAGRELRNGATMVFEEGRKLIIPIVYNNSFLGAMNLVKQQGFQGNQVREIKSAMAGILKNIHDYIMMNDIMTDKDTGLHSKIYFNLKYNEAMKSWSQKERDFSLIFIMLFDKIEQITDNEKNILIKLVAPSISEIIKNDGALCRYDDCIAIILNEVNSKKVRGLVRDVVRSLVKYRIKINPGTVVKISPSIATSSTDAGNKNEDLIASVLQKLNPA